jgi:CheY-like chemotaxis protein
MRKALLSKKPVILCVDDEVIVLESLKRELKESFANRFLYEMAENADDALEIIEELQEDNVGMIVIISDWLMPGMKGDEFLINVHEKYPNIIKVLLTGQADDEAVNRAKQLANLHSCLHKPWDGKELIKTIESSLSYE